MLEILSEASQFNRASTCRNVKYIRKLLYNLEYMDDLFKTEKVEDVFVTAEIVKEANLTIKRLR